MVGVQKRKPPVGLNYLWHIDWSLPCNNLAAQLIKHGLHGHLIAKQTGLSVHAVYYRAKILGLRLRDYRNGIGKPAKTVLKTYTIRNATSTSV